MDVEFEWQYLARMKRVRIKTIYIGNYKNLISGSPYTQLLNDLLQSYIVGTATSKIDSGRGKKKTQTSRNILVLVKNHSHHYSIQWIQFTGALKAVHCVRKTELYVLCAAMQMQSTECSHEQHRPYSLTWNHHENWIDEARKCRSINAASKQQH